MFISRRRFIHSGSKFVALGTAVFSFPAIRTSANILAPNDQINLGLIGANNRGFNVLLNHLKVPGVNVVGLCDIDQAVLKRQSERLEKEFRQKPALFEDFRDLIAQKDLDAVIIGTPDHWHCLPMVYACQEGKDVYVEKPMANSIGECNVMLAALRRYNRIVQVGQQQRSSEVWNQVMSYLKAGNLGNIYRVNIWGNFNYGVGPLKVPDTSAPEGVNYDLFLGPAPQRPFNPARFHGSWRFFWDYGGGLMTDWGVHLLDMALWVKDLKVPPDSVSAEAVSYGDASRNKETYDVMTATFRYPGLLIQAEFNAGRQVGPFDRLYGVAFVGEKGTLVADRGKWEVYPEYDDQKKMPKVEKTGPHTGEHGHQRHASNFIECLRSRQQPACPVEIGRAVAIGTHMANLAVRTGSHYLEWNEKTASFGNNRQANKWITPEYRKPWKYPDV